MDPTPLSAPPNPSLPPCADPGWSLSLRNLVRFLFLWSVHLHTNAAPLARPSEAVIHRRKRAPRSWAPARST
eukprot:scaffold282588_cov28-Tisochrysis_lutea.AAC.5